MRQLLAALAVIVAAGMPGAARACEALLQDAALARSPEDPRYPNLTLCRAQALVETVQTRLGGVARCPLAYAIAAQLDPRQVPGGPEGRSLAELGDVTIARRCHRITAEGPISFDILAAGEGRAVLLITLPGSQMADAFRVELSEDSATLESYCAVAKSDPDLIHSGCP